LTLFFNRKLNPFHTKEDFQDVEEDLRILIKQKDKLYPDVRIQIVGVSIEEKGGKDHVTVMSISEE
jgi:hypothetical protein